MRLLEEDPQPVLVPFPKQAMETSPSELVFPGEDGKMMRADTKLQNVLRRAMARAGIATGYNHVCRRWACEHKELAPDSALRRCPVGRVGFVVVRRA